MASHELLRIEGDKPLEKNECKKKILRTSIIRQHKKDTLSPLPELFKGRRGAVPALSSCPCVPRGKEESTQLVQGYADANAVKY